LKISASNFKHFSFSPETIHHNCSAHNSCLIANAIWPRISPQITQSFNNNKNLLFLDEVHFISSRNLRAVDFDDWINKTQENSIFLNQSSYSNGEVILFRTKKSRYRAIPMMGSTDGKSTQSKFTFESSLTFKEWLRRVYSEEKGRQIHAPFLLPKSN
jgi:hypothetical protein